MNIKFDGHYHKLSPSQVIICFFSFIREIFSKPNATVIEVWNVSAVLKWILQVILYNFISNVFECLEKKATKLRSYNRQLCPIIIPTFYVIFSSALELTNRTSTVAFDIEIRMKIQFEEFDDALKLVNEWQTIDPEVRFAMIWTI